MNLKLRNRLCGILLEGLKGKHSHDLLSVLTAYCREVRFRGSTRIRFKDLSLPHNMNFLDIAGCGLFVYENIGEDRMDQMLDLLPAYVPEADYLCNRIDAYLRVFGYPAEELDFPDPLDRALKTGAQLFNEALYFECHEFLEGFWRQVKGDTKELLQGIISLATALYHLEQGNRSSALKLFKDARHRLSPFGNVHRRLKISALLIQVERIEELVGEGGSSALVKLKEIPPPCISLY